MKWWQIGKRHTDLERELQADLELGEEEQRRRGLPPEQARRAAMNQAGRSALCGVPNQPTSMGGFVSTGAAGKVNWNVAPRPPSPLAQICPR